MKRSYRDLFIWQASVELAVIVVALTRDFPRDQRFILTDQMQRSAVSVSSNIAEGKGRLSQRELRHFLGVARGSLFELDTQIEIAARVGLVNQERRADLEHRLAVIGAGIQRLIAKLEPE
jgi:four helix bundle protein